MEGQNGSGSQVPAAGVETPAPGPGTAVETVVPQVETAINKQLDEAIRAAEDAEGDLAGKGPDAALEGLAQEGVETGPTGEVQTEQTDGSQAQAGAEGGPTAAQTQRESATQQGAGTEGQEPQEAEQNANGDQPQRQEGEGQGEDRDGRTETGEQQAQPETMEQRVAKLQEQVDKLASQNEKLTVELSGIKTQFDVLIQGLKTYFEKDAEQEQNPAKKDLLKTILLILTALAVGAVVEGTQQVQRTSTGRENYYFRAGCSI